MNHRTVRSAAGLAAAIVAAWVLAADVEGQLPNGSGPPADDRGALIAKALSGRQVSVIVGLRAPFQAEGRLAGTQAVQSQRATIGSAQRAVLRHLAGHNVFSVRTFTSVPYLAMEVDLGGLQALAASSDVVSLHEDRLLPPALAESVPLIGAPGAWNAGFTGAGWSIAVLDSGVDGTHPFLAGKVVAEACFSTTNAASAMTSLCPGGVDSTSPGSGRACGIHGCEHGTHVAGIAAGKGGAFSGVARDAGVIAIQIFSRVDDPAVCAANNDPTPCIRTATSDMMLGLQHVASLQSSSRIAAANMSLGSGQFTSYCDTDPLKPSIDNLRSLGIATVVASGNQGHLGALGSPACISTAVSVGSTGEAARARGSTRSPPSRTGRRS